MRGARSRRDCPSPSPSAALEHLETTAVVRRRRRVVAASSVLGTGLLGLLLSTKPDSRAFYAMTSVVAATWTAGGVVSGPLHLGWIQSRDQHLRRPVVTPGATGVGAFRFFYACALVAKLFPVLDRAIGNVLRFAEEGQGSLVVATTLATGLGEEIFFRGAMYAALDPPCRGRLNRGLRADHRVEAQPALMLAGGVMGTLFGLQRRRCSGTPTVAGREQPRRGRNRSRPGRSGLCPGADRSRYSTYGSSRQVTQSASTSGQTTWTGSSATAASRCSTLNYRPCAATSTWTRSTSGVRPRGRHPPQWRAGHGRQPGTAPEWRRDRARPPRRRHPRQGGDRALGRLVGNASPWSAQTAP